MFHFNVSHLVYRLPVSHAISFRADASTFTGKSIAMPIAQERYAPHPLPFTPITILSHYSSAPMPARWQVYNACREGGFRNLSCADEF